MVLLPIEPVPIPLPYADDQELLAILHHLPLNNGPLIHHHHLLRLDCFDEDLNVLDHPPNEMISRQCLLLDAVAAWQHLPVLRDSFVPDPNGEHLPARDAIILLPVDTDAVIQVPVLPFLLVS